MTTLEALALKNIKNGGGGGGGSAQVVVLNFSGVEMNNETPVVITGSGAASAAAIASGLPIFVAGLVSGNHEYSPFPVYGHEFINDEQDVAFDFEFGNGGIVVGNAGEDTVYAFFYGG